MSLADQLEKLNQLHKAGGLSDTEYAEAKARMLSGSSSIEIPKMSVNTWAMALHLTQLCGFLIPLGGYIVPFLIWQLKKTEFPELDAHGKMVANWVISSLIYAGVAGLLCFVAVGIPLLVILGILWLVFPIIGALKANDGKLWKYPLTISFL